MLNANYFEPVIQMAISQIPAQSKQLRTKHVITRGNPKVQTYSRSKNKAHSAELEMLPYLEDTLTRLITLSSDAGCLQHNSLKYQNKNATYVDTSLLIEAIATRCIGVPERRSL
jgi:hypothetical protein